LGIPARPYFLPIHLQPYMVERFGYQSGISLSRRSSAGEAWRCLLIGDERRAVELVCLALAGAVSAQRT